MPLMWNLTVSYGQTGNTDTLNCYTTTELKRIASRIVYSRECDTLLSICDEQLLNKDSIINTKKSIITLQDSIISYHSDVVSIKDSIIATDKLYIRTMSAVIKKKDRKIYFMKVGWISSLVAVVLLAVL